LRRRSLPLCLLGLTGAIAASLAAALPAGAAFTPSAEGEAVGVTTDHAEATRAALDTLHAGGNAVDGAIAAALTLGVVSPIASGIGGGGFAVVYVKKERRVFTLDFRETAPHELLADKMIARPRGMNGGAAEGRGLSIGAPGEPAGLEWLQVHYGKRSLAADALPAADLAARGFALGRHVAELLPRLTEYAAPSPQIGATFFPGGRPAAFRSTIRRAELARTLVRFGAEGSRPFYTGDIAAKIVEAARGSGGTLSAQDLAQYRVKERPALSRTINGRTIATMPAPSGGGLMLMEALVMYGADKTSPLATMGYQSSEYLHTLAEVMRGATADRARIAGDPDVEQGVTAAYEQALAPDQMAARRAKIDPKKTRPAPDFGSREQGTSHLIVADAEGNVVSLTTTVNGPFGARTVAGDTGILLNDQLSDFTSPAEVAAYKLPGPSWNYPRPGARPVSSMTPTIVLEGDDAVMAIGGSGGMRIATNVTQAAVCRLVFAIDPTACISAPRFFTGTTSEMLLEPEFPRDVREGLAARGEALKDEKFLGTGVQMVAWDRAKDGHRKVLAATDPRKSGLAAAQ